MQQVQSREEKDMKIFATLLMAMALASLGCVGTQGMPQGPRTVYRVPGTQYESGQTVNVEPRGAYAVCDDLIKSNRGKVLTQAALAQIERCHAWAHRVHQAGRAQQSQDHSEYIRTRQQDNIDRQAAARASRDEAYAWQYKARALKEAANAACRWARVMGRECSLR